jgi:hypothetical protein
MRRVFIVVWCRDQRFRDSTFVATENHADVAQLYSKVCSMQTSVVELHRQLGQLIQLQEANARGGTPSPRQP